MGFRRQEYWSGLPFPSPGDFPNAGIEPMPPASPALQADSLPLSPRGSPIPPFTSVHSALLRDLNGNLRFPACLGNPSFLWGIPTFGHSGPSSSSAPDSPTPTQPMFLDTDVPGRVVGGDPDGSQRVLLRPPGMGSVPLLRNLGIPLHFPSLCSCPRVYSRAPILVLSKSE